jgi:heat shock protein HslJ
LIFSQIVSTMMACTSGMDIEQVFLKALGRVTNWSITGQNLDLFDSRGTLLARFEAGYLR